MSKEQPIYRSKEYKNRHPNDLQKKGDEYEEVLDDTPQMHHKETGEFFFNRYRTIESTAKIIDHKAIEQALRVNALRTTDEELTRHLNRRGAFLKKIPFLKHGHFAKASFSMGSTPEYLLGQYYLQAPLSQLACELLNPPEGATVLDMASAPGGKTTYLAQMVGPQGVIVALDNDAHRLNAVRNNVERLGLSNVVCVKKDARFASDLKMTFGAILLDAPCGGNFCSEENWFGKRTMGDIKNNSRVQRELLRSAYLCLAPGGRLLYSTCSLEPEEDELIIDWALTKYNDLDVVPLNYLTLGDNGATQWDGKALDPRLSGVRRFWPHKTGMEGFFIALLVKKTDGMQKKESDEKKD